MGRPNSLDARAYSSARILRSGQRAGSATRHERAQAHSSSHRHAAGAVRVRLALRLARGESRVGHELHAQYTVETGDGRARVAMAHAACVHALHSQWHPTPPKCQRWITAPSYSRLFLEALALVFV